MRNKHLTKQKNGFTLTELVVVMFLLGLVTIIATSITLMVTRYKQNFQIDSKSQAEILILESAFEDWLMLFDNEEYYLSIDGDNNIIKIENSNLYVKFDGGVFAYCTAENETEVEIELNSITDIVFSFYDGNIVCCTAYFDGTNYQHKILYTMRAARLIADGTIGE